MTVSAPRLAAALAQGTESPAVDFSALPPAEFRQLGEGRYALDVPGVVRLELDYTRREQHQLKGELLVRCGLPGARTVEGVLSVSDINLSAPRTRKEHARYLAERAGAEDVDFVGLLEELAQRVLAAERQGSPAVLLSDLPRPTPDSGMVVDGLPLLSRHPGILFGDGGTAKSYIALHVAGSLAERGVRVAYFDWELAGEDHRDRLERLFGPGMPPIHYARCNRPLVYEVERLRRIVRESEIEFAIFDSVAFACDGPPEAAEVAGRYFQSLRQVGTLGSLHIAHVTKAGENADQRPFGSAFWHNGARSTWNVKLAEGNPGDAVIAVALHNRKANLSGLHRSVGFEVTFTPDETRIRPVDPVSVPDLAAGMPVRQRMAAALRAGALSVQSLAGEIDADPETITRTVRRYRSQFRVLDGGRVALSEGRR